MAEQPRQSPFSRYKFAGVLQDSDGRLFLKEREPFRFRDRPDNISHVVQEGQRWWHIAQLFYGDVSDNAGLLYWVICDYQVPPVLDPTLKIPGNTLVIVPSPDLVLSEIVNFPVEVYQ